MIVVLHGAVPPNAPKDEQDTLVEVREVSEALVRLGYEVCALSCSLDLQGLADALKKLRPRAVFNLVESLEGKGRLIHLIPSLLDHMGLPYTGASTEALFLTSNKLVAKTLLEKAGIPTAPWATPEVLRSGHVPFRPPYIVKSVWEHASVGLDEDSVVWDERALLEEIRRRKVRHGGKWFAEAYIEGREFNLSLLESQGCPELLPPAEILFEGYGPGKPQVVGYRAKWEEDSFEYTHTPRTFTFSDRERPLLRRLSDLAALCWSLFELRGYARVDFRVDAAGNPWVLEINANPCLTIGGGFVSAAEQGGISYDCLIERILKSCLLP